MKKKRISFHSSKSGGQADAVSLGGHPALDLLNTVARENGALVDAFETDEDVLAWLAQRGWSAPSGYKPGRSFALLVAARGLRETIREILETVKVEKKPDLQPLNLFLAQASFQLELSANRRHGIKLERKLIGASPYLTLWPIAEAAAELIAHGDLRLVRRCEDEVCVLWFYDRTRSHLRRWCSAETCGNRNKVRSFRERQKAAPPTETRQRGG